MAKRISKNQRTNRGQKPAKNMAKVVIAEKNEKGNYSFRQKMVPVDRVQEEIQAARS